MDNRLLYRLKAWRAKQAQKEGVELFRVLPNTTLEEIAQVKPLSSEEFFKIKGIKEGRWMKYGSALLAMTRDAAGTEETSPSHQLPLSTSPENNVVKGKIRQTLSVKALPSVSETEGRSLFDEQEAINALLEDAANEEVNIPGGHTLYTVSTFLEAINSLLAAMTVRIKGEVSSMDKRDRVVYFSLKDQQDESLLNCLAFRYHYDISGVALEVGQEVIVEGVPEIYKPNGRFSLKVQLIELSGAGALKKAYDELKLKLEQEGMFAAERKRDLPEFPERIALITSSQGAAIGDFMMNVGKYGFKIQLYNASVEGKRAVFDLIKAVRFFNRHPEKYDVLVMIRGGGSLESLQAFNNEALVREVAASKIPVLAGVGHEKDVSLAALAADVMVSTPTATARALRESWERAEAMLGQYEHKMMFAYETMLVTARRTLERSSVALTGHLNAFQERFIQVRHRLIRHVEGIGFDLREKREKVSQAGNILIRQYRTWQERLAQKISHVESKLAAHDPERLLRLGYSLVMKQGKLIRSADQLAADDTIEVKLGQGSLEAKVLKVSPRKQKNSHQ